MTSFRKVKSQKEIDDLVAERVRLRNEARARVDAAVRGQQAARAIAEGALAPVTELLKPVAEKTKVVKVGDEYKTIPESSTVHPITGEIVAGIPKSANIAWFLAAMEKGMRDQKVSADAQEKILSDIAKSSKNTQDASDEMVSALKTLGATQDEILDFQVLMSSNAPSKAGVLDKIFAKTYGREIAILKSELDTLFARRDSMQDEINYNQDILDNLSIDDPENLGESLERVIEEKHRTISALEQSIREKEDEIEGWESAQGYIESGEPLSEREFVQRKKSAKKSESVPSDEPEQEPEIIDVTEPEPELEPETGISPKNDPTSDDYQLRGYTRDKQPKPPADYYPLIGETRELSNGTTIKARVVEKGNILVMITSEYTQDGNPSEDLVENPFLFTRNEYSWLTNPTKLKGMADKANIENVKFIQRTNPDLFNRYRAMFLAMYGEDKLNGFRPEGLRGLFVGKRSAGLNVNARDLHDAPPFVRKQHMVYDGGLMPQAMPKLRKNAPYKIVDDILGLLHIDADKLINRRLLDVMHVGTGKMMYVNKPVDDDIIRLLTRRFDSTIPYSEKSVRMFQKIVEGSGLPIKRNNSKIKLIYGDIKTRKNPAGSRGAGRQPAKKKRAPKASAGAPIMMTPEELLSRYELIRASIGAGNTSKEMRNEMGNIIDKLKDLKMLTAKDHRKLYKDFGLMQ